MREIFDIFCRSGIPFLVIGGHAVNVYHVHRATQDVDCMVVADDKPTVRALLVGRGFIEQPQEAGFSRFRHESMAFPVVDVMQVNDGTWSKMWGSRRESELFGLPVNVPALPHLIALKLHAINQNPQRLLKDGNDIAQLLEANPGVVQADELQALCERYAPAGFFETIRTYLK